MPQRRVRSSRAARANEARRPGRSSPPPAPDGATTPSPLVRAPSGSAGKSACGGASQDRQAAHALPALVTRPTSGPAIAGAVRHLLRGAVTLAANTLPCPSCRSAPCGPLGVCAACARLLVSAVAALPPPSGDTLWLGPHAGVLRRLVHGLKYRNAHQLVRLLAQLFHLRFQQWGWRPQLVTHLPTSPQRRLQRGYDQAELLARAVAAAAGLSHATVLTRRGGAAGLTGRGRAARAAGLAGAFRAAPMHGRSVLLIDDVLTTGATVAAAKRALELAHVGEVRVGVMARTAPAHEEGAELQAALALLDPPLTFAPARGRSDGGHHGR